MNPTPKGIHVHMVNQHSIGIVHNDIQYVNVANEQQSSL